MASIRKRSGKRGVKYYVAVRLQGHQPQYGAFDKKSEAVAWAEEVEHALLNGLPLPGREVAEDDRSIEDAVLDYLQLTEGVRWRSRHTILTDRQTGNRIIGRFGRLTLRTLTREDIEEYKADRLAVVGPSTVRQDMSMLSRIYETARVRWRLAGIDYPGRDVPLPAPPPERRKIVPLIRFPDLLRECRASKNPLLYPLVYLLLNTGMRPEEAVLLRWRQVLWDEEVIDLTRTKTDPRRVVLNDGCLELLGELLGDAAPDDLVFLTEEQARRDKPVRFFRRAFEQACIRAGINRPRRRDVSKKRGATITADPSARNVTLYTLRHSAATYLIMSGADLETVRDILGHRDISQTSKYTHLSDEHKKAAVSNPALPWHQKTGAE
jgi:integrase